jgi:hypothetical protein
MHVAEPFMQQPSTSEVDVAMDKLKRYKLSGSDQIPAELIQTGGGETLHSEIHKLFMLNWNKEEFASPVERVTCTYSQKG